MLWLTESLAIMTQVERAEALAKLAYAFIFCCCMIHSLKGTM